MTIRTIKQGTVLSDFIISSVPQSAQTEVTFEGNQSESCAAGQIVKHNGNGRAVPITSADDTPIGITPQTHDTTQNAHPRGVVIDSGVKVDASGLTFFDGATTADKATIAGKLKGMGMQVLNMGNVVAGALAPFALPSLNIIDAPLAVRSILPNRLPITDMQNGHGWGTNAGGSHNYNSTTDPILGTQHFEATTNGASGYKYFQETTLPAPIDLTGKNLEVLIKIDNTDNLDEFQLFVGNNGLADFRKYSNLEGSQGRKWLLDDTWQAFTIALDRDYTTSGAPDMSAITSIRGAIRDNGTPLTFMVQAIDAFDQWATPPVSFIFDDGRRSILTEAAPILAAASMTAAIAMPHDALGLNDYLTIAEIKQFELDGWEIAGHATGNDETTKTAAEINTYLAAARAYWEAQRVSVSGFVYAGGEFGAYSGAVGTSTIADLVADAGFNWARTIHEQSPETLPIADPYRIRTIYVTNADAPAAVTADIDEALATGCWPVLVFHQIVPAGAAQTTEYNRADFQAIVDHVAGLPSTQVQNMNDVVAAANT